MQINDLCLSAAKLEHPPSEAKNNVYLINKSTGSVLLLRACAGSCLKSRPGYQPRLLGFGLQLWELQPLSQTVGQDSKHEWTAEETDE